MFKRALATLLTCAGAAAAEEAPPPVEPIAPQTAGADQVAYGADFFAQFNPSTAADMIARTPGFALDNGEERRGFSGAVGNVLIDGARPSAKSQSVRDILSRIPAAQVLRIEILRGAAVAGDASGAAVIANVVRTETGGSGVYELGMELTSRKKPTFNGEGSWSGRVGQMDFGVGGDFYETFRGLPGGRQYFDRSGQLTERRVDRSPRNWREYSVSAQVGTPLWDGRLDVTGEASGFRFDEVHSQTVHDRASVQIGNERREYNEEERAFELGANYERGIAGWDLSLVGLITRTRFDNGETSSGERFATGARAPVVQERLNEIGESIARLSIARPIGSGQRLEFGAEGAFNSLDARLSFTEGGVVKPVPNSNTLVEEKRAEAFAAYSWAFADRWAFDGRLARETSTLDFSGDADQTVELSFWKPSAQISREFGARNQARLRVFRDVGQLDFDDFVSAASLNDGIINGGNPDLKPETSWRAEAGLDLRFAGGAALSLTYVRAWISDTADVVPIWPAGTDPNGPPAYDAPGNIGDADSHELDINLNMPLSPLIPGGTLVIEGEFFEASVVDPLTGQRRRFSGNQESEFEAEFRQDIASRNLSWGISVAQMSDSADFRFNEIDTEKEGPWIDAFVERRFANNMRLRLTALNLGDGEIRRERVFYAPDRTGDIARVERRLRHFEDGPWYQLSVSGAF